MENQKKEFKVGTLEASLILLIMLATMGFGVIGFGLSPQTPVMLVIGLLMLWAACRRIPLSKVSDGLKNGIETGIVPIFIFILVGALISVWITAGIIPTLMVVGFKIITVKWFLPSVFIVCALVGSAVGSAFTVISTIGIAFFGMGMTLGINPAIVAGAIISGAVFGDKSSPLSESTNLTAAVVDADLFSHIKNLMWSTLPALVISFILYAIIGHTNADVSLDKIQQTTALLESNFSISFWAVVPILLMFACAWKKVPAIPTIFLNIGVSILMIFIQNPQIKIAKIASIVESGFVSKTGNADIDALLTRGGISSMMPTVSLIILTLSLGGILMELGLIEAIMTPLAKKLNSDGKMIFATILSGFGVNIFIGEQFLSVILPGNAFKEAYRKQGLAPIALGRVLEDGGTVINYLVPWGVAGSFAANTLGVPTMSYLPFVFFSLLSPIFSLISGFTGIGLKHLSDVEEKKPAAAKDLATSTIE